jgi:hypothetical protein
MLKLMYASAKIYWEENEMKNVHLATFSRCFNDLLDRTATVQVTQLTNLLKTVFITKPEDNEDNMMPLNPLKWLMSLMVTPLEFVNGHLNAQLFKHRHQKRNNVQVYIHHAVSLRATDQPSAGQSGDKQT